ncbi:MAG TPA: hypothetical protein VMU22_03365 [Rhizomicrobium sp.]|nr:hypothetical protein [Rhizomicrobium sp.]
MHHNIVLRLAIGLTGLLIAVAFAFAWGLGERNQNVPAPGTIQGAASSENAAAATFHARCGSCHALAQPEGWAARQPATAREAAVFNFLQQHGKASEAENRLLARFLAEKAAKP